MGEHDDDLDVREPAEHADATRLAAALASGLERIATALERGLGEVASALTASNGRRRRPGRAKRPSVPSRRR